MRVAALDLGTNTFLLLIADVRDGRIERVVRDEARVVRLGQGVDAHRLLHPEALARAEACFQEYEAMIGANGVERVLACATSAARDAANGDELLALGAKHAIPIEVIPGEREAELTYWGTVGAEPAGGGREAVAIIDVGGGSTEIIFGDAKGLSFRKSVDVGSVRLTERALPRHPAAAADLDAARAFVNARFAEAAPEIGARRIPEAVAVAGTATTLAALDLGRPFDAGSVDGHAISLARLREQTARLAAMSIAERQALSGMDAKRADVIVAGGLCLIGACEAIGAERVVVSIKGMRYGIAMMQGEMK